MFFDDILEFSDKISSKHVLLSSRFASVTCPLDFISRSRMSHLGESLRLQSQLSSAQRCSSQPSLLPTHQPLRLTCSSLPLLSTPPPAPLQLSTRLPQNFLLALPSAMLSLSFASLAILASTVSAAHNGYPYGVRLPLPLAFHASQNPLSPKAAGSPAFAPARFRFYSVSLNRSRRTLPSLVHLRHATPSLSTGQTPASPSIQQRSTLSEVSPSLRMLLDESLAPQSRH